VNNTQPIFQEHLIAEGKFTFAWLNECGRRLEFNPPLEVEWSAYNDSRNDLNMLMVYVDYDFGLTDKFSPYSSMFHGWHYNGTTNDTPLDEVVKSFIQYDLMHAFFHCSDDPNYTHLHWALYGNLKDQTTIIDPDDNYC